MVLFQPRVRGRGQLSGGAAFARSAALQPLQQAFQRRAQWAALRDCFTDDAQVHDEGDTISGIDNIVAWKRAARQKYSYRVEPLEVSEEGPQATLHARVSGNFPGSPLQLTYHFELRAQRIAALRIG